MEDKHMSGYVHVYTGDGKGKTTAALGLALRAAGAGWNVFFAQFAKGMPTSEQTALKRFDDRITIRQYGQTAFIRGEPNAEDIASAQRGLGECREAIASGEYRLVILDEANLGPTLQLFTVEDLLQLVDARPDEVELVVTGRGADRRLLDRADLVTEMQEIKHYYRQGVLARTGIEQ
jgi:cob(I)alamin adenosyltransferase